MIKRPIDYPPLCAALCMWHVGGACALHARRREALLCSVHVDTCAGVLSVVLE